MYIFSCLSPQKAMLYIYIYIYIYIPFIKIPYYAHFLDVKILQCDTEKYTPIIFQVKQLLSQKAHMEEGEAAVQHENRLLNKRVNIGSVKRRQLQADLDVANHDIKELEDELAEAEQEVTTLRATLRERDSMVKITILYFPHPSYSGGGHN